MILLNKGNNNDVARLTLNENKTINHTSYKIVFKNRLTKQEVVIEGLTDVSAYPQRYQRLILNTLTAFNGKPEGFYNYTAYAVNATQQEILEIGAMRLLPASAYSFTTYTPAENSFKAYQG